MNYILYIDDEFSRLEPLLAMAAREKGYELLSAISVEDGLEMLRIRHEDICSIILDIAFLSGKQGIEGLCEVKAFDEHLPVIMLTGGKADTENIIKCMEEGANGFVDKKNFDPFKLFQRIGNLSDGYIYKKKDKHRLILREEYRMKRESYEKMIQATQMIITKILEDKLMFSPSFESRIKTFKSFYDKKFLKEITEGKIQEPFNRITDIAGLRVIFYNAADADLAVKLIQESDDFVDAAKGGNLIGDDKSQELGYRAVHFDIKLNPAKRGHLQEYSMLLSIPCEIQIKTIFAHSWSKVHHVLSYKESPNVSLPQIVTEKLNEDFKEAAKKLKDIEEQITKLSVRYFKQDDNSTNTY